MADRSYVDFDITLRRRAEGGYKLETDADGAHQDAEFKVPFDDQEREQLRQVVSGPARDFLAPPDQRPDPFDYWQTMRGFGERLYDAIFTDAVETSFRVYLDRAGQKPVPPGVRIRFRLDDAPELADLPWEYLYKRQSFLILRDTTPIVRHLNHPDPPPGPVVRPPLNILVMIAGGNPPLDVEREWAKISGALGSLVDKKVIKLTRIEGTKEALVKISQIDNRYHGFHFIGHSGFRAPGKEPVLKLDDDDFLRADDLMPWLDPNSLRLVFLNSCDSARPAADDAASALAHGFVRQGIPAVIAMQFRITDDAAIAFAGGLYAGIAENWSIEASVARGRMEIFGKDKNPTEWGTPVLFTRGKESRLFRFDIPSEQQAQQDQIDRLAAQARSALDQKQYQIAIEKLQKIQEIVAQMFSG